MPMNTIYYLDIILFIPLLYLLHSIISFFVSMNIQKYIGVFFLGTSLLISFVFVGLRGQYGTDYDNYALMFNGTAATNHAGLLLENIIRLSINIFSEAYSKEFIFLVLWFCYVYLIYLLARFFKNYFYHIFLYMHCLLLPSNMLGSLRQGIAVLVMTLSILYIMNNKNIKSMISTVIGVTMHFGSVALIPIIALISKKRLYFLLFFFVAFCIVYLLQGDIIQRKLDVYSTLDGYSGGGMGSLLGKIIFAPFLIITLRPFNLKSFVCFFLFVLTILTPFLLSDFPVIAERLGIYFECYKLFIILWLIEQNKLIILRVLIVLMAVSTILKFYLHTSSWGEYFPFYIFS